MLESGIAPADIDERRFSEFLYTAGQPDPDLLIRTSGEMRISNFLLWQIAYAEIWVTDTLWPDFRAPHLLQAVLEYQKRDRRYGGHHAVQGRDSHGDPRSERGGAAGRSWAAWRGLLRRRRSSRLAAVVAVGAFIELARLAEALGAHVPRLPGVSSRPRDHCGGGVARRAAPARPRRLCRGRGAMAIAGGRRPRTAARRRWFGAALLALPLGGLAGLRWTEAVKWLCCSCWSSSPATRCRYYTGRALGRRKLAPVISPKKTVEGAVGGFVGATLVMAFLGAAWLPGVPLSARIGLGLAIAGLGIVGDLFESALKRAADVKDSSHLIPGHGGVLDRIDALLLAAPVYIAFLKFGPWQTI